MKFSAGGSQKDSGTVKNGMLYLFSSNAQPRYIQDTLNLLAAPNGYRMTFRYDSKYVSEDLSKAWDDGLKDKNVLAHFVLQQSSQYFTPVLFPIRRGEVVSARRDGDLHLIDFIVGDFVSLKDPDVILSSEREGRGTFYDYPARTAAYRKVLEEKGLPLPYKNYAILNSYNVVTDCAGSGLELTLPPSSPAEVFRSITEYLGRTETFAEARFVYASRLCRRGDAKAQQIDAESNGYKLVGGQEYELEFLQVQPGPVSTACAMNVVLDGKVLQTIGPSDFSIGSPYDVHAVRIAALPSTSVQYTTIGLRPGSGVQGPVLDIPVEVRPPRAKRIAVAAGTAVGLVLLGLSSIFTNFAGWQKFGLVAVGALLASLLNTFGLSNKPL